MSNKQAVKEKTDTLIQMTTAFCAAHLNEEYTELTGKMIRKMSRKRDVPFKRGKLETWAAATVYAVGQINFLFDKSFEPYTTPSDIAKHFGASKSTVSQKAKKIRDMFNMEYWDAEFSTTKMSGGNPLDNLMMAGGFIVPTNDQTSSLAPVSPFPLLAKNNDRTELPRNDDEWLDDVVYAYLDAREAIPWGETVLGKKIEEKDLFQLAPHIFCTWRGQNLSVAKRQEVIEMTLRNFRHNIEEGEGGEELADSPELSFAFCWLVAHFLAQRLTDDDVQRLMNHCADHEDVLQELIDEGLEDYSLAAFTKSCEAEERAGEEAHKKRLAAILGDCEIPVNTDTIKKFAEHLKKKLQLPCTVEGIEDFRWEESYILDPGDKEEYEALKKNRPSYTDTYELLDVNREWGSEWIMCDGQDIGARARRISDGKEFILGLAEIEATDIESENYQVLDDYAVWFVNNQ